MPERTLLLARVYSIQKLFAVLSFSVVNLVKISAIEAKLVHHFLVLVFKKIPHFHDVSNYNLMLIC